LLTGSGRDSTPFFVPHTVLSISITVIIHSIIIISFISIIIIIIIIIISSSTTTPAHTLPQVLVKKSHVADWIFTSHGDGSIKHKFKTHISSSSIFEEFCRRSASESHHGVVAVFHNANGSRFL
jgi:hypothetical protein